MLITDEAYEAIQANAVVKAKKGSKYGAIRDAKTFSSKKKILLDLGIITWDQVTGFNPETGVSWWKEIRQVMRDELAIRDAAPLEED